MSDLQDQDEADSGNRLIQPQNPEEQLDARREAAFYRFFQNGPRAVWLTTGIIFANAAVFGAMVMQGVHPFLPLPETLKAWGANYAPLTTGEEPWRLFTAMFLHGGIIHLGVNMYALWQLGRFVERLVGHAGFLILYLVSGLSASLVSTLWHPDAIGVGASGAILGVFGAIFALLLRQGDALPTYLRRAITRSVILNLAFITLLGMAIPFIDMAAHTGGLVAGLAMGALLVGPLTEAGRRRQWQRNIIAGLAGGLGIAGVFGTMPRMFDPIEIAAGHIGDQSFDAGLAELNRLLSQNPKDAKTLLAKISLLEAAGRTEEARAEVTRAIGEVKDEGELAMLYLTRAELAHRAEDWKQAEADLGRALSYAPDRADRLLLHQRGFARMMLGDDKGAEEDWRRAADLVPSHGFDKTQAARDRAGSLENIGMIYLRNGQWEEALRWTDSVNRVDPGLAWNWLFRGIAAARLNRTNEARAAFARWRANRTHDDVRELRRFLPPEFHDDLVSSAETTPTPAQTPAASAP